MTRLIQKIQQSLAKQGLQPRTNVARSWMISKIKNLNPSTNQLMNDRNKTRDKTITGKMYFFMYDPKLKDSLPYYDRFPLVIPIERYQDGFLGLNLHYIHPKQRIILLDKLSETLNNQKYDDTTKFRITYSYLSNAARIYESTPCLKKYLFPHIKSKFLEITSDEWDIAALLPVERFEKATKSKVFSESRKKF
jgi:hypothetical protein